MFELTPIAHYREIDKVEQTVKEHLLGVSNKCEMFAQKLCQAEVGRLLGLLHDFGKYSNQFQAYLRSATGLLDPDADDDFIDFETMKGKIDHSSAGAQYIWEKFRHYGPQGELAGQILAVCLASHHSGLMDCLKPEGENGFKSRMRKDSTKTFLPECTNLADSDIIDALNLASSTAIIEEICQKVRILTDPHRYRSELIRCFNLGFYIRFLFSCLIDADRIDSADFESPKNVLFRNQKEVDWSVAIDRLESKLEGLPVRNKIDEIRGEISAKCKERGSESQGIFTLTVPTGGGKTFASMRFALHHARMHKLDRIIYVIPYTSIIEQNAEEIRKVLEKDGDTCPWVLEHHSNLEPERQTWRHKLIAQNWDSPVVFTTMVQFLDTLFSGGTRGARRLHQLSNSVVIFDEIQTLPIKCVHMFCNAINFLSHNARTTALLCTATQPLLDNLKSPDKGQLKIEKGNELVDDVAGLFESLKRVEVVNRVKHEGWSESEIAELALSEFGEKGSCLVIVNTKAWAQSLYRLCKDKTDSRCLFHLSTSLCPAHRKKLLKAVRDRLDAGEPVLCISTQLIEAGVDVDFASVIRFLAGLDSIAQASGRCNRNGRRRKSTVHVVNPQCESIDMLKDIKIGKDKALRLIGETANADLLDPDVMSMYFSYYFYERADEMAYQVSEKQAARTDNLLNLLSANPKNPVVTKRFQLRQSFKTAGKIFEAIDAPTRGIIVPYEEGKEIITALCAEPNPSIAYRLLKSAQRYSVNVFPHVWKKLCDLQAVMQIQDDTGIYFLDDRYYSSEFGLSIDETKMMDFQYT